MPVAQVALKDTIQRLSTFVRRMEQRYECTSELMAAAVEQHHMKETAEIASWLISYRTLQHLLVDRGSESGTATKVIA